MTDTRGTFRLKEVRNDILNDEYVSIPSVFVDGSSPQNTTAGYYIGGSTQSPYVAMSNIDKLTYATETISTPPNASGFGRYTPSTPSYNYYDNICVSNNGAFALFTNYHICNTPSPAPVMYKHDFSTDDVTTVPSLAPVFPGAGGNGGAGTAETAWWHASQAPVGSYATTKITYATESYTLLPSSTGFTQNGLGSNTRIFQNQLVAGFTPANSHPSHSNTSICKKLTFSTDTFTNNGWTLPSVRSSAAATDAGNDDNTGLVAGGYAPGQGGNNSLVKCTLNNSTVSSAPNLPAGRYRGAGHSSGSSGSGYISSQSSGAGATTAISKVPFSSYSWSTIPATLSSVRRACIGYSGLSKALKSGMSAPIKRWIDNTPVPPNTSYGTAGNNGPSPVYKFDFATTTASLPFGTVSGYLPGATQSTQRSRQATLSSGDAGYMSGGTTYIPQSTAVSNQDKLTYSTDTTVRLPSANLGARMVYHTGVSDGTTSGWYWGGNKYPTSYNWTNIYKITFSTDAASTSPAQLVSGTYQHCSTNSATAGYTFGGHTHRSSCNKLQFSTESTSFLPSAMPGYLQSSNSSATGNQLAGYVSSGNPGYYSEFQKMSWATETGLILPSTGSLSNTRNRTYCVGNSTDGFWCGGSPASNATIDNLNYATETGSNVPSWEPSPMAGAVYDGWGVGARNAGIPVALPPTVTPTPSTTNLGIPENGYIAGGFGNVSSISKLDMSSETFTRLTESLYEANRRLTGFGNLTQGYATGGTQPVRSNCQKFVYSTDTRTTLTSNLSAGRGYMTAIGNNTAGYVGGGTPQGSYGQKLDKMPYSNETFSALPSLPGSRYRYGALGNQTQGYFAGGYPSQMNKVKKITYSNDSYANAPNLSYPATFQTGTGNATKGYVVSGEGGGTRVDRVTFSNDTISRVPSADLSATRYSLEANNSPSKAYFTGGGPGVKTNTEIITFSNDTTALSTTANADTGDNQAGAFAAFGPNHCGNPGSDIQPNII